MASPGEDSTRSTGGHSKGDPRKVDGRSPKGTGGRKSGGAPRKYSGGPASTTSGRNVPDEPIPGNPDWGGLARKGALRATQDDLLQAKHGWEPEPEYKADDAAKYAEREERRKVRDERTEELREEARTAVARAGSSKPRTPRAKRPKQARERVALGHGRARNEDASAALRRLLGPVEAKRQIRKLNAAAQSFEAERYNDAVKSLKSIVDLAPSVPEVRELYGLTLYRLGRFQFAAKQLEEFRALADSADQNPVLADCYRAQQRWADVDELWRELADASPSADLVNEGRIVMAGALADQGDLDAAVRMLEKGWKRRNNPQDHHLRRAYALADLYERSGDLPRARALFDWVVGKAPDFVDARQRLGNLR